MTSTRTQGARAIVAGALVMVLSLATPSSAVLVSMDLVPGSNDGLITLDTATGLEWLDLTPTLGVSLSDVYYGYGGFVTDYGFRFASDQDVWGLYSSAGVVNPMPFWGPESAPGVRLLLDLMSGIVPPVGQSASVGGFVDVNPYVTPGGQTYFFAGEADVIFLGFFNGVEFGAWDNFSGLDPSGMPHIGTYLVRPVPEPSTLLLLGSGLAGLGGTVWRRNRKRQ